MPSFNQRLGISRYDADEHYRRALDAFRKGDYEASIPEMNEAIRLLPTRAEYYAARGLMLLEDDAVNEARADFEAAIQRFAYEVLALYGLGVLAYRAKRTDEAIACFQRAHYADQKRPETLYYLALAHLQGGDLAKANEAMTRAHALFEAANDKRKADSGRWVREIARATRKANTSSASTLPLALDGIADDGESPLDDDAALTEQRIEADGE